jgi:hypothetical protein
VPRHPGPVALRRQALALEETFLAQLQWPGMGLAIGEFRVDKIGDLPGPGKRLQKTMENFHAING